MPTKPKKKVKATKAVKPQRSKAKPSQPVKAEAASESPVVLPVPGITPVHQWTHDGDRVLLLKCVDADGKSHGGFDWNPDKATAPYPIKPAMCSRVADCESGGLFGWPWGVGIGCSKTPDYSGQWIVFSAPPSQVIDMIDKAKVCADSPSEVDCRVEFIGHWSQAVNLILDGRVAWTQHASSGAASATGGSGAASATGWGGAASATGWSGAASATGWSGAASATGWGGAASATDESGAASATGWGGAASATGGSGAASATGWSGAASATGWGGAASATGERGAASATGGRGAASITGPQSTIEIGHRDAGVVTADEFTWVVHRGAVLLHRWEDGHKTFVADDSFPDGAKVRIVKGEIVEVVLPATAPTASESEVAS